MLITKGKHKFIIMDIDPMELSNIYDAFTNAFDQMTELLKKDDETFMQYLSVNKEGIPELKKIMQDKIKFYDTYKGKILNYATTNGKKIIRGKK